MHRCSNTPLWRRFAVWKMAAVHMLALGVVLAQQSPVYRFEVASVRASQMRPSQVSPQHLGLHVDGGRLEIGLGTMLLFLELAYKADPSEISGPAWMASERYDIVAKLPDGTSKEQISQMLQSLLAERFKLQAHQESKMESGYALLIGPDGPKLKESSPDGGMTANPLSGGGGHRSVVEVIKSPDGLRTYSVLNGHMTLEAEKISMSELASDLMLYLGRPVIDITGLKGYFQVTLDVPGLPNATMRGLRGISGDGPLSTSSGDASDPDNASIISSVRRLGLKLEKRKVAVDRLVVDHIERVPTDN